MLMESQGKAEELSSFIISASSAADISAACVAIESFLCKHIAEQSRAFFSITFPVLICRAFGFEDAPRRTQRPTGWIDQILASNNSDAASRVFNLLSPSGILMSSIFNMDRHSLIRYVFPTERLPEWVKCMLHNEKDCGALVDLCALFKNRVTKYQALGCYQVQLGVFEYYLFWFAYYPVCKGNSENTAEVDAKKNRRFRLENWSSLFPGLATAGVEQRADCNVYIWLLYAYLRAFVPNFYLNSCPVYRSSVFHYLLENDGSVTLRAEFLIHTLVNFWLVDNDFSPLPVSLCRSYDIATPFRSILAEAPPTAGLGEIVKLLVKYMNYSSSSEENIKSSEAAKPKGIYVWKNSAFVSVDKPSFSYCLRVGSHNSLIQRPVYRFILRSFIFCPTGASLRNVCQVFSLWMNYIQPWKITPADFFELNYFCNQPCENSRRKNAQSREKNIPAEVQGSGDHVYMPRWQGYVISNYLFYTSLVMHFCVSAHKFFNTNTMKIMEMVLELLDVLISSRELLDLLKNVDAVYHSKQAGSPSVDRLYKYIPSICEQLEDWQEGLCEHEAVGSILHKNWSKELRFFDEDEGGGCQLLQLLVLRAEAEIHSVSGDHMEQHLKILNSVKAHANSLFGASSVKKPKSSQPVLINNEHGHEAAFTPHHLGTRKSKLADVRYRGDWMKRPISNHEVAWLVRQLVRFSDWVNGFLGLGQDLSSPVDSQSGSLCWSYIDMSKHEINHVGGLKQVAWMIMSPLVYWLAMLGQLVLRFAKEGKLRVNLRPLASKKVVTIMTVCVAFCALRRTFGLCPESPLLLKSFIRTGKQTN